MDGIAEGVAENLNFDVAGIDDRALEDHGGIAERGLRLGARTAQGIGEGCCIRDQPHAAPAAAGNGLEFLQLAANYFVVGGEEHLIPSS